MTVEYSNAMTTEPQIEEVRAEIADFQQRIRESGAPTSQAFRDALVAYAPFLQRRIRLLAQLNERPQC